MKLRRFLRIPRLSILAALTAALAAVGLMSFTASAGADFNLELGLLLLQNGVGGNSPPAAGSWVLLINRNTGELFLNTSNTLSGKNLSGLGYTPINGSLAGVGLELGRSQPTGGIFGPLTPFDTLPFYALTLPGSKPLLTFSGSDTDSGLRALLGGNLLGLDIQYNGELYNVGTQFNPFTDGVQTLTGVAHGNLLTSAGLILLHWETALLLAPFNEYDALFHWVAKYHNP